MPWTATTYCGVAMLCDTRVFSCVALWVDLPICQEARPCGRRAAFTRLASTFHGEAARGLTRDRRRWRWLRETPACPRRAGKPKKSNDDDHPTLNV